MHDIMYILYTIVSNVCTHLKPYIVSKYIHSFTNTCFISFICIHYKVLTYILFNGTGFISREDSTAVYLLEYIVSRGIAAIIDERRSKIRAEITKIISNLIKM